MFIILDSSHKNPKWNTFFEELFTNIPVLADDKGYFFIKYLRFVKTKI